MSEKTTRRSHLSLWVPIIGILAAIIVFIPEVISPNVADVLYIFVVLPGLLFVSLCFLVYAAIRKKWPIAVMLVTFWAFSTLLFGYEIERPVGVRSAIRWLLWSREYKSEVLAQPGSTNVDFKHIEWDGWGWGGSDTSVFLVFDPTDSLAAAAKSHQPGKFKGIPCEVPLVRRLESHWYSVMFYTNTSWDRCE